MLALVAAQLYSRQDQRALRHLSYLQVLNSQLPLCHAVSNNIMMAVNEFFKEFPIILLRF
jgi:hypothetical protein